ncbi:hypothetical protein P4C99_04005 [Pontiellaceae bacterium B1224]|nr:hypothetical protein [Pontiellaceae bacterium B1224]
MPGIVVVMAGWASAGAALEEYSIVLGAPNGYRIPRIMGASGDPALTTGYDYFNWYGITEHRTWFKPSFSSLADDRGITSAAAFAMASKAIRKDPLRQTKSSNFYIDWDHPYPSEDAHGWGSVSWEKVKTDIYGKHSDSNPWNYGMYDYHRYGEDAARSEEIMLNARKGIANARNDPNADIPLVITEYNTSTGGNFDRRQIDTEDLLFGISMAQILEVSAVHGPAGLGDDGGIFIFKLGVPQSKGPLVGLGNKLSYVSQKLPYNYGGITRGFTDGPVTGLGLCGEFVGAVSFHSSEYVENYLDVTDTIKSISEDGAPLDVTFVVVRLVRYNVNEYENSYYTPGDYHYDGRVVQIASKEHADTGLRPKLIIARAK